MSALPCETDADLFDPHAELNHVEDELIDALGAGRTGLLLDVLRAVVDDRSRTETRRLLDLFLEV